MGGVKLTEKKRTRFEVRPIYRVSELATMVGMSKWAMMRMLRRHQVDITMGGKGQPAMVTLIAIRVGLPDVWESILLAKALQ